MPLRPYADVLEDLYARLNRRRYVHPDPLEPVLEQKDASDREVAGLIASALAYGNVKQIIRSVAAALERVGSRPAAWLKATSPGELRKRFAGFRHRVTSGEDLAALLFGAKQAIRRHGSLRECFAGGIRPDDETVLPALGAFVQELWGVAGRKLHHLLPDPARGSACKRLNLFLRWMVRRDEVDPGGWNAEWAPMLIVPLDTHMHRSALALGATRRKTPGLKAALEITQAFRAIRPDDPVRYDFALTRLGIRADGDLRAFLRRCGAPTMT